MTNKLVVIINSHQKLRKCYYEYMKWNFLYQITAASRTPDYGATVPRSRSLCPLSSTEFVKPPPPPPPPPNKISWVRHWCGLPHVSWSTSLYSRERPPRLCLSFRKNSILPNSFLTTNHIFSLPSLPTFTVEVDRQLAYEIIHKVLNQSA